MGMNEFVDHGFRMMGGMMILGLIPFFLVFGLIVFIIVRNIAKEKENIYHTTYTYHKSRFVFGHFGNFDKYSF